MRKARAECAGEKARACARFSARRPRARPGVRRWAGRAGGRPPPSRALFLVPTLHHHHHHRWNEPCDRPGHDGRTCVPPAVFPPWPGPGFGPGEPGELEPGKREPDQPHPLDPPRGHLRSVCTFCLFRASALFRAFGAQLCLFVARSAYPRLLHRVPGIEAPTLLGHIHSKLL